MCVSRVWDREECQAMDRGWDVPARLRRSVLRNMVSRLDRVCVRGSAAACANRSRHPAASFLRQKKKTRRCVPTNHTQAVFCFACRLWELLTSGASSSASMTNLASLFSDSEISRSLQLGLYRTFRQNRSIRAATAVGRQGPRRLRLTFSSFPHFGSKFFHRNQPEYIPATLSQQQKFVHVFVHVHRLVLHRALVYTRSSLRVHIACAVRIHPVWEQHTPAFLSSHRAGIFRW